MIAHSKKFGDIEVTALSDGVLATSLDVVLGMDRAEVRRLAGTTDGDGVHIAVNAFLLKLQGRWALIDAGAGNSMGPTLGKLPEHLRAFGVAPEEIAAVFLTHIHPDHSNGLVDDAGRADARSIASLPTSSRSPARTWIFPASARSCAKEWASPSNRRCDQRVMNSRRPRPTAPVVESSLPGLTRQSIFFREKISFARRWMRGSSPRMTNGFHSITSSARKRNASGTFRPSTLAVVRLKTRSNLVGCSTGISAGFVPRRIMATYSAAPRARSWKV